MANVFDLTARLIMDASNYEQGMEDAQKETKSFASKLGSGLAGAGKAVAGVMAGTAVAVGAVTTAMIGSASATAQYGDKIDKQSQQLGISAKAYQEWDAVLQHSGTSMDAMGATFKTLANATQYATDDQIEAFKELGMSMEQVQSMSAEDLWTASIKGLQGMEKGTRRTALATKLLGRGAQDLAPLLNTSAEETQAMIDAVNELGGVMSDDAVKASAEYQDSLQDMTTAFDGVKREIGVQLMPVMTNFMNFITGKIPQMSKTFSGLVEKVGGGISKLTGFLDKNGDAIWGAVSTVFNGVVGIASGIWDGMSSAFEVAKEPILSAVNWVVEQVTYLKTQAETEGTPINTFINGIGEAFTAISGTAETVVGSIVGFIGDLKTSAETDGTPFNEFIQAIGTYINEVLGFWETAIPKITGFIHDLFTASDDDGSAIKTVWEGIKSVFSGLLVTATIVLNFVSGLIKSLTKLLNGDFSGAWDSLKETVSQAWEDIKNAIMQSPIGGLIQGIINVVNNLISTVGGIVGAVSSAFSGAYDTVVEWGEKIKQKIQEIADAIAGLNPFASGNLPDVSVTVDAMGNVVKHATGYDSPYLMRSDVIFGKSGGQYHLGGDKGSYKGGELLYSHDALMNDISNASGSKAMVQELLALRMLLGEFMPELLNRQLVTDTGAVIGAYGAGMHSYGKRIDKIGAW